MRGLLMGTRKTNRLVGVGGLAALANKDYWQARPRLTLTYHIFFVFKQVSWVGGLAVLAKKDSWQAM